MTQNDMTPEQKKKWEESKALMADIAKQALKDCDVPLTCNNCGEYIGYTDEDITMDYLFVCVSCGEKND